MRECTRGHEAGDEAVFCSSCGERLPSVAAAATPTSSASPATSTERSTARGRLGAVPWPAWVLCLVLGVLAVGVAVAVLTPEGSEAESDDFTVRSQTVGEQCQAALLQAAVDIADGNEQPLIDEYGTTSKIFANAWDIATYGKNVRYREGVDAAIEDMSARSSEACDADTRAASRDPKYG